MTTKQVLEQGPTFRRERGDDVKKQWLANATRTRFGYIPWTLEARAISLRQAGRRWRARGKGTV